MTTQRARTFEDLQAWQCGRGLARRIYQLTHKERLAKDYGLRDQLRRAAVSAMSNVAEGFERGSNRDFVKFLFIAKSSAGEVRSLLYVALDQQYITKEEFEETKECSLDVTRTIWGLIKSLRNKVDWITGLKIFLASISLGNGLSIS